MSNNYCATLEYNQGGTTGYVHLCDIPGEGITHTCLICMHAHAGLVYPRFTSRICMQPYCPFFFTTTADTCIVANLPRCSTMPNTIPMSVTVRNRQHQVLFSATSSRPGKQLDIANLTTVARPVPLSGVENKTEVKRPSRGNYKSTRTVEPLYNGHHWEPKFCP